MPLKIPGEPTFKIGALAILSLGFILSAILRAGEVVAALPQAPEDGFGNPIAQQQQPVQNDIGQAANSLEQRIEVGPPELLAEVRKLREKLSAREEALNKREIKLRILEERMKARLKDMREARERLAATAELVDDAASKDVRRLAEMYQQMKPKQAGQIFNEMASTFAAGFIAEMRPDAAALILANMEASKAYAVSLLIAGRNLK